ncbi:hypothetical protein FOMPIDRAFT_1131607 [Fomitopsis schrenkii]|uniref:F-box domain-containing protein n=1 Tax=Fomitopsis schrenkii TaxID=2126942 RepID=S8F274_FOMSC|nr:hypothetical protein FOMPIDRAFT_1131607 [Fomitopsis schrenkii]
MLDMPTDVIFEILRRLHPRTLLILSWTSKSLYTYLMKKSSVLIWRACLKNALGLPPCPQNVIEPVYTAFMFSTHCMACGTSDAALPVWGAYIRLCRQCAKSKA